MANTFAKPGTAIIAGLVPQDKTARIISSFMLALLGSIVLWISAKTHVPFFPVPMTLQTLAILVIGATFGFRLGLAAIGLYLIEGMLGMPVFSGTPERGIGIAYMMGPTAGYLVGFVVATGLVGWFAERGADRSFLKLFVVMSAGTVVILASGFAYLASIIGAEQAWAVGVVPFLFAGLFKTAIAALVVPAMGRFIRR